MVRTTGAQRRTLRGAVAAALAVTLAAAGCGEDDFANDARGPAPITVSAVITPRGVAISPQRVGSGPIELLGVKPDADVAAPAAAQPARRARRAVARADDRADQPGRTATLNADVAAGTYVVSVRSTAIEAGQLVVTATRGSAQDRLLVP